MGKQEIQESKYTADEIARYIIALANKEVIDDNGEGEGISNLKLQKMLYFVQAYFLVVLNRPAFKEDVCAWKYGPVVKEIYDKYKVHERNPITPTPTLEEAREPIAENDQKVIENVWGEFGEYSATTLLEITHRHDPWIDTINNSGDKLIPNLIIKKFYFDSFTAINDSLND